MLPEKVTQDHYEYAAPVSDGVSAHYGRDSTKRAVAAWVWSMFFCTSPPRTWGSLHRRSIHEHSNQQYGHSRRPSIKKASQASPTLLRRNTSRVSVATLSIKGSLKVKPEELFDNTDTGYVSLAFPNSPSIYQPMPYEDSIRLLRVHRGELSDPVEVTLEFARLNDRTPQYEALSYVWGSSITVSHIIDNSTRAPISVTRNLYDAVKSVRQADHDRIVWVDALCINQNDGKEKGEQVRMMNHVYTCAARVIVWLGADEDGDAHGSFGVLCSLANAEGECAVYETRSRDHASCVPDQIADIRDYEAWKKVMMFFCQTWFTRLWVLQEIVLARDAVFIWGDCCISWTYVGAAMERIRTIDLIRSLLQTSNLQNAFLMWHLSSLYRNAREAAQSISSHPTQHLGLFSFLHLLDISRSFDVTDLRDKVYGLLGFPILCNDLGAESITPDYSLSVAEVYTNTTRRYITAARNLEILAYVIHTAPNTARPMDHVEDFPSWVPTFDAKSTIASISNTNAGHQYSAGLSRPLRCLPSTDPRVLHLEGTILDTIIQTGPKEPFVLAYEFYNHLEALVQWYMNADISPNNHELAMLLTAGRDKDGRLLSPAEIADCAAFLSNIIQSPSSSPSTLPKQHPSLSRDACLSWQDTIHRFATYRQLFLTTTGKVGLGPQGLEEGDKIAVLWGGQCPFVIKDLGDEQWVMRGECFVRDWMEGIVVANAVSEAKEREKVFAFV